MIGAALTPTLAATCLVVRGGCPLGLLRWVSHRPAPCGGCPIALPNIARWVSHGPELEPPHGPYRSVGVPWVLLCPGVGVPRSCCCSAWSGCPKILLLVDGGCPLAMPGVGVPRSSCLVVRGGCPLGLLPWASCGGCPIALPNIARWVSHGPELGGCPMVLNDGTGGFRGRGLGKKCASGRASRASILSGRWGGTTCRAMF